MISKLDTFFDAVPRSGAYPVDIGAFTLFVSDAPFEYYARPSLAYPESIAPSDLVALEEACAARDVGLSIEWMRETQPELAGLAQSHGLEVRSHELMVVISGEVITPKLGGVTLRLVESDDSALVAGLAVANLSFGFGGTEPGSMGHIERDIAVAALDEGVETALLSAQNTSVARAYERVGFRRVGSTGAAERRKK